jgi:hypothetical protein
LTVDKTDPAGPTSLVDAPRPGFPSLGKHKFVANHDSIEARVMHNFSRVESPYAD